jgi:hypothetical protein
MGCVLLQVVQAKEQSTRMKRIFSYKCAQWMRDHVVRVAAVTVCRCSPPNLRSLFSNTSFIITVTSPLLSWSLNMSARLFVRVPTQKSTRHYGWYFSIRSSYQPYCAASYRRVLEMLRTRTSWLWDCASSSVAIIVKRKNILSGSIYV